MARTGLMRILHASDSHVGFSAYSRISSQGLNQREQDFFRAFEATVDLAIEEAVDVYLHSGDLFDTVRPTNRAVAFVMDQLRRLADANIPFVALAGNHETPKLRETGSVFRVLEYVPGTHVAYKGRLETFRVGDCAFHLVPHCQNEEVLHEQVQAAKPDPDAPYNILGLHVGVVGVGDFRTGEFNEQTLPQHLLSPEFDYIALGHYHAHTKVTENAWYAGSTERCTFKEVGETKGVRLLDLAKGTQEFREVPTRPMITLDTVDCTELAELEMPTAVYKALDDPRLEGAVARLFVRHIPRHVYANLDFPRIRKLGEPALHLQVNWDVDREGDDPGASGESLGSLRDEFETFFTRVPVDGLERDRLRKMAVQYIDRAERPEEGASPAEVAPGEA